MSICMVQVLRGTPEKKQEKLMGIAQMKEIYEAHKVKYPGFGITKDVIYVPIRPMHYKGLWWQVQ